MEGVNYGGEPRNAGKKSFLSRATESLLSRVPKAVLNALNPEVVNPDSAEGRQWGKYQDIEQTWRNFIDDLNGWESVAEEVNQWLKPICNEIKYCDSCQKMQVSSKYKHNFGCTEDAYQIGGGKLLAIAVQKNCLDAVRLLKSMKTYIRPKEYISALRFVLTLNNRVEIIRDLDWRWLWGITVSRENISCKKEQVIAKYVSYVQQMLGDMFSENVDLDISNLAHADRVLDSLLPKKSEDSVPWSHFMVIIDTKDVLTPLGTNRQSAEVRGVLEKDYGILWRPSTREFTSGQRDIIIDLAVWLIKENIGLYSVREQQWFRIIQRNRAVKTAICLAVMELNTEIKFSSISVGEQHFKRKSLDKICPGLGIGPSWWERFSHRYFSCFLRRPKKRQPRSWFRKLMPCAGGPKEETAEKLLLETSRPARHGRLTQGRAQGIRREMETPF